MCSCDREYLYFVKHNFCYGLFYVSSLNIYTLYALVSHKNDHLHWSTRLRLTWNLHRKRCLGARALTKLAVCIYGICCVYLHLYSIVYNKFTTYICMHVYLLPNKQEHTTHRTNNTFDWLADWVSKITNK